MQHVHNILRVYHHASSGELDAGLRWYLTAHEEAVRLSGSETSAAGVAQCAAVIAALSPGLRWERNIEAAERVIHGIELDGLGVRWYDGVKKAKRILAGERPEDVLQGNKVKAFFDNILNPTTSHQVVIDGHAYCIWQGERANLSDTPNITDEFYTQIESDYTAAANEMGIRPLQMQAITWTVWRRLHGVSSAHYLPLFEE